MMRRLFAVFAVFAVVLGVLCGVLRGGAAIVRAAQNPTISYVTKEFALDSRGSYVQTKTLPYVEAPVDAAGNYGFKRSVTEPNFKALMIDGSFVPQAVVMTVNGYSLVPARIVAERLDAGVAWDGSTRSVTVTKGNTKIVMAADGRTAYVNGAAVALDAPVTIKDGVTYVPLRFIAETLGGKAGYTVLESEAEAYDVMPFPIVWIESSEFAGLRRESNSAALTNINSVVIPDIDANYSAMADALIAGGYVPGHFDKNHVYRLLKERTADFKVLKEFSCFAAVGDFDVRLIYDKISRQIYVYNAGWVIVEIVPFNLQTFLFAFNLQ